MIVSIILASYYVSGLWFMWCGYLTTPEDERMMPLTQWAATFMIIPWLWGIPVMKRLFKKEPK